MDSGDSTGEPTRVPSPSLARFTPWLHQLIDYQHLDIDGEPDQLQRARLKPPADHPPQSPTPPVVAVKRPTLPDGTTLARSDHRAFLQEAQAWADVHDHPYIPTVIGWDDNPHPWLAVEYADHGSLAEYTDDTDGQLGVHHAVWTVQCLAKALDHAHARDQYHQDVTPHNVLLFASEDGWPVPKVGDWGLARARNEQGRQSFTPGYAAPEQRQPTQYYRVHPRKTDLYQLGTILYELLTGKMPFSRHEREHKHREPPSPPSHHRDQIPQNGPLDTLVTQLLAPDPNERPRSMAQVVTRLATCREQLSTSDSTNRSEDGSDTTEDSNSIEETLSPTDKTTTNTDEQDDTETYQNSPSKHEVSDPVEVETQLSVESTSVECEKRVATRDSISNSRVIVNYKLRSQREGNRQCELTDQLPPGVCREDISVIEAPQVGEFAVEQPTVRLTTSVGPDETVVWVYSVELSRGGHLRYLQAEPQLDITIPAPNNWRTFQATIQRDGGIGGHTGPDPPATTRWQFDTHRRVRSSPAVADNTVYVGCYDNSLYAVDAATGIKQWQFNTSDIVYSSPAVVDSTVYVGSRDNRLYAVDTVTGDQRWQFNADGSVDSSPVVVDGTVYVGSDDNNLYAVDADTGDQQWHFNTGGWVSSPTVADGTVYVGSKDKSLYAVDAFTGNKRWQFDTGGWIDSSPAVVDGTVYIGSDDNNLYAVNAITGEQQWQFDTSGSVTSSPAVVNSTVYIGSKNKSLYAVNAITGEQQWQFNTSNRVVSSPAVVDGTVYVGSWDYNLYAVDATTGNQEWQFDTSSKVVSSPAVADGIVYVGNNNGTLYAIRGEGDHVILPKPP